MMPRTVSASARNCNDYKAYGVLGRDRGEFGWNGSAGTIFWVDPTRATVIVLMAQSSLSNTDSLRQRFKTLIQQALVD